MKKILYILLAVNLIACNDFLDVEPQKSSAKKIETVEDLDLLLNEVDHYFSSYPDFFNTDNCALPIAAYDEAPHIFRAGFIEEFIFETNLSGESDFTWNDRYKNIWLFNQVINTIDKNEVTGSQNLKKQLKAEAHFLRATEYFALALNYCLHPSSNNADEMGLPLRTQTDYEESLERASLQDTYNFIEADLIEGLKLDIPYEGRVWRASSGAVKAFAARFYLYLGDFTKAAQYADDALTEYSGMIDYASVFTNFEQSGLLYPHTMYYLVGEAEYLDVFTDQYMDRSVGNPFNTTLPSQELLDLYDTNDERYDHFIVEDFLKSRGIVNNSYFGYFQNIRSVTSGPSTAEMYLIRAETKARNGDIAGAMADVENVRMYRFTAENYTALSIPATKKEAIQTVIDERRREMPFSIRWYDIRRINVDPETDDVTIRRRFYPISKAVVNDNVEPVELVIEPNSRLYARPIGNQVLILSNGQTKQNTY